MDNQCDKKPSGTQCKRLKKITMKPNIKGLSHITFICKDLEKTSHLFKEVFGATEMYSSDAKNFSLSW